MSNFTKKLFSSFISLTTIAWSVTVGTFALPTVASAAMAGDLIKASGPAVYYYAADGKRYPFPNERTYFSWYRDFSSVRTISDAELAAIPMAGANVTIRPGTYLVKITTDPKVYAVTRVGTSTQLRWIESEAVAISLYGSNWAQRVVDVPDTFFPNYAIGPSISTAMHPEGSLIMQGGMRYVVSNNQKRMTSDSAFMANGFNSADVMSSSIVYPNGSDLTGREAMLADTVYVGATNPVGGNLQVSLASDTPAGVTVPKNAASVMLAKYNFTAGGADVLITGLRVRRIGVGATSDFSNVYLYDAMGNRLTTGRTINSQTNLTEYSGLNITVPAGQTKSLVLVGDFANPSSTGGQHSFEITDAASTIIGGTGQITGSFPVRGNVFTVGTTQSARLDVQKGTTPSDVYIGASDAEISNFKLTANTNDVEVRRVTLLQAGSITNTDITDLKLYQGSTLVASASGLVGDKIVLNFNPAYVITNGTTKTFSLRAKVGGRADRNIKTYIEYTTDVYAVDRLYNAGASICIASSGACTTGSFDGSSSNFILVNTKGGQFTVSFNGPATANVAKGTQDVVLFKFGLTTASNEVEVRNVDFHLQGVAGTDLVVGSAGTKYFRDVKIKNLDTNETWMGPYEYPTACGNSSQGNSAACLITMSDTRNVPANTSLNLAVTADLSNTEDAGNEFFGDGNNQYRVVFGDNSSVLFGSSDVRIVSSGEFLATSQIVPNTAINGNVMTVKSSSLDIALAASPAAATVVKNQGMIPAVGFVFNAGAQSDVSLKSVKLTGRGNATTSAYETYGLAQVVTSCALFDGNTQVGIAQNPDTTAGTMNITNINLMIPRGTNKTLIAKCTADSTVAGSEDLFAVGIASSGDVTAEDQEGNTLSPSLSAGAVANSGATPSLAQTVKNSGTVTQATNNLRQSTILVSSTSTWQNMAEYKLTSQFEELRVDRVAVTSSGDGASFIEVAIAQNGTILGTAVLPAGTSTTSDVDLLANPLIVPKDSFSTFQLWARLAPVDTNANNSNFSGLAHSGALVSVGVAAGLQTGEWDTNYSGKFNLRTTGQASGERVYATGASALMGSSFVVRKTKPTVTKQALDSVTLTNGDRQLYNFTVSADAAGPVAWKKVTFKVSRSNTAIVLSNFQFYKAGQLMNSSNYSVIDQHGNDLKTGSGVFAAAASTTGHVVVYFPTNLEETVSGSGTSYSLRATVSAVPGTSESVTVSFLRTPTSTPATGYLTNATSSAATTTVGGILVPGPNLNTAVTADPTVANAVGTFVWSDQSENPHSADMVSGGSRDWTDDLYVDSELSLSNTISK